MPPSPYPGAVRIVIGVDPSVTSTATSDEVGIIAGALGRDNCGYVLGDYSGIYSPETWASIVVNLYWELQADRVVAEVNNGGDMVEAMLRTHDRNLSYRAVHATRGKQIRAEPIVALYEQGRIFHVRAFPELEAEMCNFDPRAGSRSPSRMDALVWVFTELFLGERKGRVSIL